MNGKPLPQWVVDETEKISHRAYSTGFYNGHEPGQTVNSGGYIRGWDVAAVCAGEENGMVRLSQRNRFFRGETVSVLEPAKCRMTSHLVKSTTRIWSQSNPHRTRR